MKLLLCLFALAGLATSEREQKIVGGSNAAAGQFPHQVSLQRSYSSGWAHICGGSLIKVNRVLTAAHCVDPSSPQSYRVVLGNRRLNNNDGTEQTISISSIVNHSGYNGNANGFPNDISVMRLSSSASINSAVQTITMAPSGSNFDNQQCIISGWGRTSGSSSLPNILQYTDMKQISQSECTSRWGSSYINSNHICVYETGKSACNGDSGGPMVCSGYLAGVTSWGASGCPGTYPSVYTRVSNYISWINSI